MNMNINKNKNIYLLLNIIFKKFNLLKNIDNYILNGGSATSDIQNNNGNQLSIYNNSTQNSDTFTKTSECNKIDSFRNTINGNIAVNNTIIRQLILIISKLKLNNIDLINNNEITNNRLTNCYNNKKYVEEYLIRIINDLKNYNVNLQLDYDKLEKKYNNLKDLNTKKKKESIHTTSQNLTTNIHDLPFRPSGTANRYLQIKSGKHSIEPSVFKRGGEDNDNEIVIE